MASAVPSGTGMPTVLAATSRKQRSWTERAKKEKPTCSSHRFVVWSW